MSKPALTLVSAAPVTKKSAAPTLTDRRTEELVFAFVGPVGSGVSYSVEILSEILRHRYNYTVQNYKISSIISRAAPLVSVAIDPSAKGNKRTTQLQTAGNKLRQRFGNGYLAEKCVEAIGVQRVATNGYEKKRDKLVPVRRRQVHIIDSLKNPSEIQLLKDVYGDVLWIIGVFAPEDVRKTRLKGLGHSDQELANVMLRDEAEGVASGQRVRDTIQLSDFFIRNDQDNDVAVRSTVQRFLDILLNVGVHTPTRDESAMYNAVSAASRSACLSRQVGAAIYSSSGEMIGIGANDVPKFNGGLYSAEDGERDARCFMWGGKICHNDSRKSNLAITVFEKLQEKKLLKDGPSADVSKSVKEALFETEIRNLIEYSRSVHAEMEAIISVARGHKSGIVGSTLYCTTFPCHSCARHIVASGISRVVYVEPYPKSLALDLHRDSTTVHKGESERALLFQQYEGVAPINLIKFFKHGADRKSKGKVITVDPKIATPVFQPPIDGFTVHEQLVVTQLEAREKELQLNVKKRPKGTERRDD